MTSYLLLPEEIRHGAAHQVEQSEDLGDARDIRKLQRFRERTYPSFFRDGKYPPNTLLVVNRLASEEMRLEIARDRGARLIARLEAAR